MSKDFLFCEEVDRVLKGNQEDFLIPKRCEKILRFMDMNNDELAQAIQATHKLIGTTDSRISAYVECQYHFKELLAEQLKRAQA